MENTEERTVVNGQETEPALEEEKSYTLLEEWRRTAYDQRPQTKRKVEKLWDAYYEVEKGIYIKLLEHPEDTVTGTVKELAEKYGTDILTMTGFLDGINESLKEENPIETMTEDTQVSLAYEPEKLFRNMVQAKADWLYGLPQWDAFFDKDRQKELIREQRAANTIIKPKKIGRNDPCPCGSGKKYKYCCGKTA